MTPIIDLMAISNAHFAKLRDFITLRLPPGFPVKIGERVVGAAGGSQAAPPPPHPPPPPRGVAAGLAQAAGLLTEIPLFHVLNARITFSNLCGCDEPLSSVWVPAPGSAVATSGTAEGGPGAVRFARLCVPGRGAEQDPSAAPREPLPL